MPRLKHLKPCKECPFRRKSAPGWLGASTPEEFIATTRSEHPMPCHCAIDYEKKDWETEQYPDAPLCAGSLVFLKNHCIAPRNPELADAVRAVEADAETVFQWSHEFIEHHRRDNWPPPRPE
jgi:hypothetical protein